MPQNGKTPPVLTSPYAKRGPYRTNLSSSEERNFQKWVKSSKIPWQDSPQSDYDMRGYWKAQQSGNKQAKQDSTTGHFPDTWKTPYHKTFSNESIYATSMAPHWEGQSLVPYSKHGANGTLVHKDSSVKYQK